MNTSKQVRESGSVFGESAPDSIFGSGREVFTYKTEVQKCSFTIQTNQMGNVVYYKVYGDGCTKHKHLCKVLKSKLGVSI